MSTMYPPPQAAEPGGGAEAELRPAGPNDSPPDMAIVAAFLRFGAFLRRRGLPATTGRMLDLLRALAWIDLHVPDDFYWAARCMLTERVEDLPVFDAAFMAFFRPAQQRAPEQQGQSRQLPRSQRTEQEEENQQPLPSLRVTADVATEREGRRVQTEREAREDGDQRGTQGAGLLSWSGEETLRRKDFAALSPEELRAAKRLLAQMQWKLARRRSRRLVRASKGRHVDWRRSLRRNIGYGGCIIELERQRTKIVRRPLIVLADVSGSMDRYTRPVLQLAHTMRQGHGRVEAFVFGTRLTRVTRHLRMRDPDQALTTMSDAVHDWAGGTRIGDSLNKFNKTWGRRVLGRGSVVIVVSDGWDRGDPYKMSTAMAALQRRCHRLVWLNPALGGPTVRPVPLGMKAAMPYIDNLMPARSLNDLARVGILLASITSQRPTRRSRPPVEPRI